MSALLHGGADSVQQDMSQLRLDQLPPDLALTNIEDRLGIQVFYLFVLLAVSPPVETWQIFTLPGYQGCCQYWEQQIEGSVLAIVN